MKNFRKAAPYLYLTRGSQEGSYVLFLLVPVGPSFDVNLDSASLTSHSDRFEIAYSTVASATTAAYRLKQWTLTPGSKQYVKVACNADAALTMKLYFLAADSELAAPASDNGQRQAPYIFMGKETVDGTDYARPSCIVLFDEQVYLNTEAIAVQGENCYHSITCSASDVSASNSAPDFTINQDLRLKMTTAWPYFEASVEQDTGVILFTGPQKKKRKVATNTPGAAAAESTRPSNGQTEMETIGVSASHNGLGGVVLESA
jgi:hypothetical protein